MTVQIPPSVQWLVPIVVGGNWPEGDEDALRRLAQAWEQAATVINQAIGDGDAAAQAALGAMRGAAADAFGEHWERFVAGDEQFLVALRGACGGLAAGCDEAALQIEYTKLSIIAALLILAAQIAAMVAAAWATLGASTAGVPIAQAITRITVQQVFQELITQIGLRAAVNVAVNLGVEGLIQGVQQLRGHREGWDAGNFADLGVSGLIAGGAAGAFGAAGRMLGTASTTFGAAAARGAAEGALAGAAGNYLNEVRRGNVVPDPGNLASGAVSGSVGGALDGTVNRHRGLHETWHHPEDSEYTAGPNHQGWRFTTEDGTEARANVQDPYTGSWNSGKAQHIPPYSAPNTVGTDEGDDPPPRPPGSGRELTGSRPEADREPAGS